MGPNTPDPRTSRRPLSELQPLIRAAQRGDKQSFGVLVEAHAPSLLYYFAVRGSEPEAARDAVQETFLRACQSLRSYDGRSPFPSWLYGIARNVHLQALRRQGRQASAPLMPRDVTVDQDPAEASLAAERREVIRKALAELPERMQIALQLRFVEKKSCAEIAAALGTTLSAVSPLIFRAKAALRKRLVSRLELPRGGP